MSTENRLDDTFQLRGDFRVRGSRQRLKGVLTYEAGAIELELHERFAKAGAPVEEAPSVMGKTNRGACTLVRAWRTGGTSHSSAVGHVVSSTWTGSHLLVGGRFDLRKKLLFRGADYYFDELDNWYGPLDVDQEHDVSPDGKDLVIYRYARPDAVEVDVPSHGAKVKLFTATTQGGTDFQTLRLVQTAGLRLESDRPEGLDWFMERLADLRALLSLLMGESVTPSRMAVWPPASRSANVPPYVEEALGRADVFFPVVGDRRTRQLHPASMLFTYDDVRERFPQLVRDWFAMRDQLLPVVALLSGTVYTRSLPGEFRFLALTQALETLHRRTFDGLYVDESRYKTIAARLVEAIPAETPRDLRDSLKTRIEYGNEYAQRRRFAELWSSLPADPRYRVIPDKDFLVKRVVDERNYLTHLPRDAKPTMTPTELFLASMRLRAFLSVLLLARLGLVGEEVSEGLRRLDWFRGYVH